MRFGLYGKLPAKRDFVAVNAAREFLAVVEPWLQGSLSASRAALGPAWQAAFLRAPLWRFWLGPDVTGLTTMGAFMPSVDGVGRYFPLLVFVQAEAGEALPPPEFETYAEWFPQAEDLLLSALDEGATFEEVTGGLGRLPVPSAAAEATPGIARSPRGTLVATPDGPDLGPVLSAMRRGDWARHYGAMTYWWTTGGEDFAPRLVADRAMPDPYVFTVMLTGRQDGPSA